MRLNKFLVVGCLMLGFPAASFSETFNQDDLFKVKSTQPAAGAFARTAAKINSTLSQNDDNTLRAKLKIANAKIAGEPNNYKFFGIRGQIHADLREYREAIADFSRALELGPDNQLAVLCLEGRGAAKGNLNDDAGEVEDVTAAIKIGPLKSNMFVMRAGSYCNLKRYGEGLADANRAIELDPNDSLAYSIRAVLNMCVGNSVKALDDCNRAIALGTLSASVYEVRSKIYARQGKTSLSNADLATFNRYKNKYGN